MRKELRYMVFDCETATLPFADEIANGDPEAKKKIAITRPLIYDMGWTITNRKGEIIDSKQFLVAEIFSVPAVFNTAYYADKRPIYLDMIKKGEIAVLPWNNIVEIFMEDLDKVNAVGAYNSMFDFKKAIPFTELYVSKLYSPDYYAWEAIQYKLCETIISTPYKKDETKIFEPDVFKFRGNEYMLFDLWGLATKVLLNNASYKKKCLQYNLISASGMYFKTSAETSYQYLMNKYDFIESHTALSDATIETFILSKIASRHAIEIGITFFPFRELGETTDFVQRLKRPNIDECATIIEALENHLATKEAGTAYYTRIKNKIEQVMDYMGR